MSNEGSLNQESIVDIFLPVFWKLNRVLKFHLNFPETKKKKKNVSISIYFTKLILGKQPKRRQIFGDEETVTTTLSRVFLRTPSPLQIFLNVSIKCQFYMNKCMLTFTITKTLVLKKQKFFSVCSSYVLAAEHFCS